MSTLKVNNLQDLGADAVVTNGVIAASALPAGSILQVVQATKTDTSAISVTSFTTISGLSVSITPTSSSSKFLLIGNLSISYLESSGVSSGVVFRFGGGNADSFVGDARSTRERIIAGEYRPTNGTWEGARQYSAAYLDSPATTSPITYVIEGKTINSTGYVNRTGRDLDNATYYPTYASSLIVMEVAG